METRFSSPLNYEKELLSKGIKLVAGIDEVGRGPLAGPLVACAVILDLEKIIEYEKRQPDEPTNNDVSDGIFESYTKINDSKLLIPKKRAVLDLFIRGNAFDYSIFSVSNFEIDEAGISKATQTAFFGCVRKLKTKPDFLLTDKFEIQKITKEHQLNLIRGDRNSISIAAASIVAKVYRDGLMVKEHLRFPVYGFDRHKGYGTKEHMDALFRLGPCEIHRRSFEPLKSMVM